MARVNRREVLSESEVQVVHCLNRCVRRAFLCGEDPTTGRNHDARRERIRHRMEFLASVMGIEVLAYAVMSNHFHVILRNRPDVVATWSDAEVARRWWQLCPGRRDRDGQGRPITAVELEAMQSNSAKLAEWRSRLSSISWFMRFLTEKIARDANKEDDCTGRFWEGRFKAQVLLDEAALLACMQYVELNPVRAGVATTPEGSRYTSARDRILDAELAQSVTDANAQANRLEHGRNAGWLQPVPLEPRCPQPRLEHTGRRSSNLGCVPMELGQYLALLEWTGRRLRSESQGAIPAKLAPIFDRLGVSGELWVESIRSFRRWFRGRVGRPGTLLADAHDRGHSRPVSIRRSRDLFA